MRQLIEEDHDAMGEASGLVDVAALDAISQMGRSSSGSSADRGRRSARQQRPQHLRVREDGRGFVYVAGRAASLGKISCWNVSVSARCTIHSGGCRRAYSFEQIPYGAALQDWLVAGLHPAVRTAKQHMDLEQPMRR